MKLLVCGSRDWHDRDLLEDVMARIVAAIEGHWGREPTIIQGLATSGADRMARRWALKKAGLFVEDFPADWDTHGKRAGYERNRAMLDAGDVMGVVAFSSESKATKGTGMMCRLALKAGLPVMFVGPDGRLQLFS